MSGEVGTSQTEVDLKALEGFLVGNQDLERLDALCSTTSTSSRPRMVLVMATRTSGCGGVQAPRRIKQDSELYHRQEEKAR
jgi:hypothetical protein